MHFVPKVENWMFREAVPRWVECCVDPDFGGPVESFSLDGKTRSSEDFRRTRVTARQIYVMSHAALLGASGARQVAENLFDYLVERVWQGPAFGWVRKLTVQGGVLDPTPDLYDYAFCLFGLGWYHKLTGDRAALELAFETYDNLTRRFRHPSGLGFHNQLPITLPRQQNPHMHLMEAALVLADTSGDSLYSQLADELADVFCNHFFQSDSGLLPEFFDDELKPLTDPALNRVEPGHQFEWAWILTRHQMQSGRDHSRIVRTLVEGAERFGVSPENGFTYNAVGLDEAPLDRGSRTWPNTERIKGWLALHELAGDSPWGSVGAACDTLFEWHLGPTAPEGMWIDAFNADGKPTAATIPSSTLYHIFLAFAEILRVAQAEAGVSTCASA